MKHYIIVKFNQNVKKEKLINPISSEGKLEWIKIDDLLSIKQFEPNENLHHSYLKMNYLRENFYWMMNVKL